MKLETCFIETDNGPVCINKSDFDPEKHKEAKPPKPKKAAKPKDDGKPTIGKFDPNGSAVEVREKDGKHFAYQDGVQVSEGFDSHGEAAMSVLS